MRCPPSSCCQGPLSYGNQAYRYQARKPPMSKSGSSSSALQQHPIDKEKGALRVVRVWVRVGTHVSSFFIAKESMTCSVKPKKT